MKLVPEYHSLEDECTNFPGDERPRRDSIVQYSTAGDFAEARSRAGLFTAALLAGCFLIDALFLQAKLNFGPLQVVFACLMMAQVAWLVTWLALGNWPLSARLAVVLVIVSVCVFTTVIIFTDIQHRLRGDPLFQIISGFALAIFATAAPLSVLKFFGFRLGIVRLVGPDWDGSLVSTPRHDPLMQVPIASLALARTAFTSPCDKPAAVETVTKPVETHPVTLSTFAPPTALNASIASDRSLTTNEAIAPAEIMTPFELSEDGSETAASSAMQFSLLQLFNWTTAAAIVALVARGVEFDQRMLIYMVYYLIPIGIFDAILLATIWAMFGSRIGLRWLLPAGLLTLLGFVLTLEPLFCFLGILGVTCLIFGAYRSIGYRLYRLQDLAPKAQVQQPFD